MYCNHTLVHTGQNYDTNLNEIFFKDLEVRQPDFYLGVKGDTFAEQIGKIFSEAEKVINKIKPDRLLILGDTNSGLVSIIAKRLGVRVFHMEAGNRCFDDKVPEEVNRRVIDHSSAFLLPYTQNSKDNLLREGIEINRIYVTGNPIYEVINTYRGKINKSTILESLNIKPRKYFLVTMHREENVDQEVRLSNILNALDLLQKKYDHPIICSLHPRTKSKIQKFNLHIENKEIHFLTPLGFFDFIFLEKNAFCVISDSGTVQEECCIFRVPNITIRDVTERPETLECGSNMITSVDPGAILNSIKVVLNEPNVWGPPVEYLEENVSGKIVKLILGYERNGMTPIG